MAGGRWSKFRERVLSNLKSAQPRAGMVVCPRPTADSNYLAQTNETRTRSERACLSLPARAGTSYGQVAEWSKAADCKSADPCGLRRFEPSPVHQMADCRLLIDDLRTAQATASRKVHWQKSRMGASISNRQSKMTCGSNSMVESQPSKLLVAGSIPVSRSRKAVTSDECRAQRAKSSCLSLVTCH